MVCRADALGGFAARRPAPVARRARVTNALDARKPRAGLLRHSDRGSTYASADYGRTLERHELIASTSSKGDCWDNAVAESFFATLRAELLDHLCPAMRADATTPSETVLGEGGTPVDCGIATEDYDEIRVSMS